MAKLETTHIFDGSVEQVFAGLRRYEQYPEFLPGVQGVEITNQDDDGAIHQVRYDLRIIKEFFYVLNMSESNPTSIRWELAESNLMKANTGSWNLEKKTKNKTTAKYSLEVRFKGLIPSAITDKIAQANLPAMFAGFQKLIDQG